MANYNNGYTSAEKNMLFVEKTLTLFRMATSFLTGMKKAKICSFSK